VTDWETTLTVFSRVRTLGYPPVGLRVRPSVRLSVRPSVRPSVCLSVRPFVRPSVRSSVRTSVCSSVCSRVRACSTTDSFPTREELRSNARDTGLGDTRSLGRRRRRRRCRRHHRHRRARSRTALGDSLPLSLSLSPPPLPAWDGWSEVCWLWERERTQVRNSQRHFEKFGPAKNSSPLPHPRPPTYLPTCLPACLCREEVESARQSAFVSPRLPASPDCHQR